MNYFIIALQCIVAISILNVWLVQNKKTTQWRGGKAKTLIEEFKVYGLPVWSCYAIGTLKVVLALGIPNLHNLQHWVLPYCCWGLL